MIDDQFTNRISSFLAQPIEERDLFEGAEMLLQLNRNRHMHAYILRTGDQATLDYELTKHLKIRLDGLTLQAADQMAHNLAQTVCETLATDAPTIDADNDTPAATRRGRRSDHDSLPPEIQALYDKGGELYFRLRQLHSELSSMLTLPPCERYDRCVLLRETHEAYRKGWATYDNYKADDRKDDAQAQPVLSEEEQRAVSAARKYISTNKNRLSEAQGDERIQWVAKLQERVNTLLSLGQVIGEDTRTELSAGGITFSTS